MGLWGSPIFRTAPSNWMWKMTVDDDKVMDGKWYRWIVSLLRTSTPTGWLPSPTRVPGEYQPWKTSGLQPESVGFMFDLPRVIAVLIGNMINQKIRRFGFCPFADKTISNESTWKYIAGSKTWGVHGSQTRSKTPCISELWFSFIRWIGSDS